MSLRDHGDAFAIATGDFSLPDRQAATTRQGRADTGKRIAIHGWFDEIGFAFNRGCSSSALWHVQKRPNSAQCIAQLHDRAAMHIWRMIGQGAGDWKPTNNLSLAGAFNDHAKRLGEMHHIAKTVDLFLRELGLSGLR